MSALVWPAGAVVALDGENIDGENNELVKTGDDAFSWKNSGSFATDFKRGTVASTPLVKKLGGSSCVSFDGRSDLLSCLGSATALKFIHETMIFDMALVFRRLGKASPGNRLFGAEPKGCQLYFTLEGVGTVDGGFEFIVHNGTSKIIDLITTDVFAPVGEVTTLFVRGDGAKARITDDFWNWEEQALFASLGTGNASTDYGVGSDPGQGTGEFYTNADFLNFLIWPRNLDASELDTVRVNFTQRKAATL